MTSRDFAYWLQGWFELENPKQLTADQLNKIKTHLNMVFVHDIDVTEQKESGLSKHVLDKLHRGGAMPDSDIKFNC